jgi:general secretion pathway protein E
MDVKEEHLVKVEDNKKKIGELLLKYTALTEDQLNEALQIQKEDHKLLGDILLNKNYIHPHDIIKVLCHQIDIPYLSEIKVDEIDPMIVMEISINYAKQHEVLPIFQTDYAITIAMSDPFDFNAINDLNGIFKKKIHIVVSTPLKIQDAINKVYEKANQNMVDSIEDEF